MFKKWPVRGSPPMSYNLTDFLWSEKTYSTLSIAVPIDLFHYIDVIPIRSLNTFFWKPIPIIKKINCRQRCAFVATCSVAAPIVVAAEGFFLILTFRRFYPTLLVAEQNGLPIWYPLFLLWPTVNVNSTDGLLIMKKCDFSTPPFCWFFGGDACRSEQSSIITKRK